MYDYIIVGAGSAGCVLANRLTANPACQVLLLEAGGEDNAPQIHVPATFLALQDTPIDWAYRTAPQAHLQGRRIFSPRGRVLGGTSSINYMMYVRGNRRDYDHWRDLGNTGWGYDDVLPYFKRSEDNRNIHDDYHGQGGPLTVSGYASPHPWCARFLDSAQEAGLERNHDFNGAQQAGCGLYQATIRDGQRCSTARAFLQPARKRANLTIATHATATRVMIEGDRAVGVEYLRLGKLERAAAGSEVIVCGGAFNSPHLLMVSGIGAASELERLGIDVRADVPGVGRNLQDHLGNFVGCELTQPLSMGAMSPQQMQAAREQYGTDRTGPLATNLFEAGGFASCGDGGGDPAWPDLQLFMVPGLLKPFPEAGPVERHGVTIACYINRPKSSGRVTLASADPLQRPVIDPDYLKDPADVALAVKSVRLLLQLLEGKSFDAIRGPAYQALSRNDDDATIEAHVRRTSSTTWHVCGTCKMGVDDLAVVDPTLKVRGVRDLRVVDVSVMPTVVSANTNAGVIMIAEKAADLILGA